jgi:hypothetical protein
MRGYYLLLQSILPLSIFKCPPQQCILLNIDSERLVPQLVLGNEKKMAD